MVQKFCLKSGFSENVSDISAVYMGCGHRTQSQLLRDTDFNVCFLTRHYKFTPPLGRIGFYCLHDGIKALDLILQRSRGSARRPDLAYLWIMNVRYC